jgi:hypothetical protein
VSNLKPSLDKTLQSIRSQGFLPVHVAGVAIRDAIGSAAWRDWPLKKNKTARPQICHAKAPLSPRRSGRCRIVLQNAATEAYESVKRKLKRAA